MTKKDVLSHFRDEFIPLIPKHDTIAKREAWNNYTDSLCKNGEITDNQYNNWSNPF